MVPGIQVTQEEFQREKYDCSDDNSLTIWLAWLAEVGASFESEDPAKAREAQTKFLYLSALHKPDVDNSVSVCSDDAQWWRTTINKYRRV